MKNRNQYSHLLIAVTLLGSIIACKVTPSEISTEIPTEILLKSTKLHYFSKIGRNEKCPCGSGKKYKKCCIKSV